MTDDLAVGCVCGRCEPGCQNAMCRPCCEACLHPNAWPADVVTTPEPTCDCGSFDGGHPGDCAISTTPAGGDGS